MLPKTYAILIWKRAMMPVLDFFTILLFYWLTYQIRYVWQADYEFFNTAKITPLKYFAIFAVFFAFVCIVYYAISGLYTIKSKMSLFKEFATLALGVSIVMGWCIVYFFFSEYDNNFFPIAELTSIKISRFLASFGVIMIIFGLYFQRLLIYIVKAVLIKIGFLTNQIVLVGNHPKSALDAIYKLPNVKIKYTYQILDQKAFDEISYSIESGSVQELYITTASGSQEQIKSILILCERYKIITNVYNDSLPALRSFTFKTKNIKSNLYMELKYSALEGWGVVSKRIFDLVFSLAFIIIFSPVYLIAAIAIVIEDRGNPFYLSERVGPDGKNFSVFKFRRLRLKDCTTEGDAESLKKEAELIKTNDMRNDGVLYKIKNDPRTTKVGKFLEKTSIDELPQFFNVLMGNMSIVGPRPHQPREVAKYEQHHFKVLNIKPGITGLAQINGRSDLTFDQEVEFDTSYVKNWSFWLDLKIILLTPIKILGGHKN